MNSSFRPRQAPMQRQAQRLADQGRYGDSMMVHMNPTEVQVLNQMAPGGLTRNPQTGQPEAFAFLAPLIASMAAKGALGAKMASLATLGGTITSPIAAGALASGITTTAQTGSLEEGIKSGLMSGLIGKVGGDLIKGLGDGASGATQQIADTSGAAGSAGGAGAAGDTLASTLQSAPPTPPINAASAAPPSFVQEGLQQQFADVPTQSMAAVTPETGGMFSGIGEAVGDMGIGDIATPMLQGAVTSDAIAMYPGDGGDMQEEEKDDFYQEVRAGDRGIQMPEMGYDAGRSGEFDYFANPFQVIPVAKTGGHVKKFQTGGQTDEPIQLTGLRGFDQVTPPPSFDFSSSNIYGPAPVNQAETNLSTAGPANIASTTPVASPFAGIGMFNFGSGGRREYGPTDAEMFSYLTGRGGLPANLPANMGAGNVAEFIGGVETPDFASRVPGRFPRASYEDLAMQSMESQAGLGTGMEAGMPAETFKPFSYRQQSPQNDGMQSLREAFGTADKPRRGGIGGRNPDFVEPVSTEIPQMPSVNMAELTPYSGMPSIGMGGAQMGGLQDFNVDSYMQDTMYSPSPTPTRIPGYGSMGMGQDFRFMT